MTVGIDLLCAIAAFLLERHFRQTEIKTFGSAAFWTTTRMPTVSSQIKNPLSLCDAAVQEVCFYLAT